jgi:hypothetical protein
MFSKTRTLLRASLLLAIAATSSIAVPARANPGFPMLLQQNVPMPCLPPCTICHQTNAGGYGTIRPGSIGASWKDMFGLDGGQLNSLVPALMAARSSNYDSDMDGIPDVTELAMGENPSDATNAMPLCNASGGSTTATPKYGCAHVAPRGKVDDVAAVASAIVALLGVAALRRRGARGDVKC